MEYIIDKTNQMEYIYRKIWSCEICDNKYDEDDICEKCGSLPDKNKNILLYSGYAGSILEKALSIDYLKLLMLFNNYVSDNNKRYDGYYVDWIKQFNLNGIVEDDVTEIFYCLSPFTSVYDYFVGFERYAEMYETFLEFGCNQFSPDRYQEEIISSINVSAYINSLDDDLLDVDKFVFACTGFYGICSEDLEPIESYNPMSDYKYTDHELNAVEMLSKIKEEYYTLSNSSNSINNKNFETYHIDSIDQFFAVPYIQLLKSGYKLKKCNNCGKLFIPRNRSDTLYCDRKSPQDNTKTCKEYGAIQAYKHTLETNEASKLYRNIYMSKQMLAKRNPDIPEYATSFEKYKEQSKQWKKDVKAGAKTEDEFIEWLKSVKEKKVL